MLRIIQLFILSILAVNTSLFAATKDTIDVVVTQLSSNFDQTHILVQTTPRPDISGLNCTNNYWLILNNSAISSKNMLTLLLTAHATGKKVIVHSSDINNSEFCQLQRITIK